MINQFNTICNANKEIELSQTQISQDAREILRKDSDKR